MRNIIKLTALAAVLSAGVCAMQASAGEGSNVADKAGDGTAAAGPAEELRLASELAHYGRENRDAMALIVAAGIAAAHPVQATDREKTSDTGGDAPADKGHAADMSVDGLLADARALAGQDAALLAAADRVGGSESKGRVQGAASHTDRVLAHDTDYYNIEYKGGEDAWLLVSGDGDTDLDLWVYDENGNEICSDTDNTDQLVCNWQPRWTGNFQIKIKNFGGVYNEYRMVTN